MATKKKMGRGSRDRAVAEEALGDVSDDDDNGDEVEDLTSPQGGSDEVTEDSADAVWIHVVFHCLI